MTHAPQTALRNRRIVWNHSARGASTDDVSRAFPADRDRPADGRDPGDHHCVCSSDHCNGTPGNEYCRGNADGGADATAALDLGSSAFNPSTVTYLANCDPGDEGRHARHRTP